MIEAIDSTPTSGRPRSHPYLTGNFAPISQVQPLTPCAYSGTIPEEFIGGQYVRNGGNPVTNEDLGRDAHWFDGDGMLSGVAFRRTNDASNKVQPEFVNQFVLTDVYLSTRTTSTLRTPILPSIATLVNPLSSLLRICLVVFRTIALVILSRLWGSQAPIHRISVANTNVIYHDGRALATCESGPPMRVALPGLETVGWFDGRKAEGEGFVEGADVGEGFGGKNGLVSFMKEWTTAHPRVDPRTKELILFHSTFIPPYVQYSIVPSTYNKKISEPRLLNAPVPGVTSARMMHDFGVGATHTVIMDLPLSLDPVNLARNKPVVAYDPEGRSRFGVFPRRRPDAVRWFETAPCCIFHTANTWHEESPTKEGQSVTAINMLACRLTSAALVFSAGDVPTPTPTRLPTIQELAAEEDQCRLYYYRFDLDSCSSTNNITHQFALSAIPFEFPSIRADDQMGPARFIYGCTVSDATFGAALGKAAKIDAIAKVDVQTLIARGTQGQDQPTPVTGCVDKRSVADILADAERERNPTERDPIQIFKMPPGWFAQEVQFVPRSKTSTSTSTSKSESNPPGASLRKPLDDEDAGYIIFYAFDESQLDPLTALAPPTSTSELWIVDAADMSTLIVTVKLPQRVPYGLHGEWFSEDDVKGQRPVQGVRALPVGVEGSLTKGQGSRGIVETGGKGDGVGWRVWMRVRLWILGVIG